MTRLQKLYDSGIRFIFRAYSEEGFYGQLLCGPGDQFQWRSPTGDLVIGALWEAAKRAYPDAECFRENNVEP